MEKIQSILEDELALENALSTLQEIEVTSASENVSFGVGEAPPEAKWHWSMTAMVRGVPHRCGRALHVRKPGVGHVRADGLDAVLVDVPGDAGDVQPVVPSTRHFIVSSGSCSSPSSGGRREGAAESSTRRSLCRVARAAWRPPRRRGDFFWADSSLELKP